jgi:hypothetical protein
MKKMTYILNVAVFAVINQFAFADAPNWEDNAADYEYTATLNGAAVLYDGVQLEASDDILAAFDDAGNVRGIALLLTGIPGGPYAGGTLYEMQIRSNNAGDHITYKYYDASEDVVLDITQDYTFIINDVIGNVLAPTTLDAVAPDLSCPACDDSCVDNDAYMQTWGPTWGAGCSAVGSGPNGWATCDYTWGPPFAQESISDYCPVFCDACPPACPVEDDCGVCEGDGSSCNDCAGTVTWAGDKNNDGFLGYDGSDVYINVESYPNLGSATLTVNGTDITMDYSDWGSDAHWYKNLGSTSVSTTYDWSVTV